MKLESFFVTVFEKNQKHAPKKLMYLLLHHGLSPMAINI